MITKACSFETERLAAGEWHSPATIRSRNLADTVIGLLSPAVTSTLPPHWQGGYDRARALEWIADRDGEGTVLVVTDRATDEVVGLVILGETPAGHDPASVEVRLGYLLAESAWGRGLATELVGGVVEWCRAQPTVASIAGGVEAGNAASERVLTKNGFTALAQAEETGEQIYAQRV